MNQATSKTRVLVVGLLDFDYVHLEPLKCRSNSSKALPVILGNENTLMQSSPIWRRLVINAKDRCCFHVGNEDETLARVITNTLVELGQFDGLLDINSLFFKEARWKVVFDDDFLKSIVDIKNPKTYKEIHSLLMKLSGEWRPPRLGKASQDSALFQQSEVNCRGLSLVWSIDIIEENVQSVQVLKVWDILQGTYKSLQLVKRIHKFYEDYSKKTLTRCKEKSNEGYVFPIFVQKK